MFFESIQIFSQKTAILSKSFAHACDHAHVTLQWRSCVCKLDRAIHLDLIIIVHYLGLLQCSPVVNADWIGSVFCQEPDCASFACVRAQRAATCQKAVVARL